jgi:nitric oxide reductase large subunit
MQYRTQRVAYPYFILATILFGRQVVCGAFTATKYAWNFDPLVDILPFNTSREIHLNLLVVWLLLGFMGGASSIVPEESGRELWRPRLAWIKFWLFAAVSAAAVEARPVLFTGITGTGHHYCRIGTPDYWLWFGGIFSARQPLPILLMVIDTLRMARKRNLQIENRLAVNFAVVSTVVHFFGAGVWGFAQTLPRVNRWTHGTPITASHGHSDAHGTRKASPLSTSCERRQSPSVLSVSETSVKRNW